MGLLFEAARAAARKAHEEMYYNAVCTVTEYQDVTDESTGLTRQEEAIVYEDLPCNLSHERQQAVVQTDEAASMAQGLKLFIAPEVTIRAGSKLRITQCGLTIDYAMSGEPAVYPDHQEIMLELFRGWS